MSVEARFKSPEHAAKFFAAYDATLALWQVPRETLEVTTSFGTTHINVAGSPDAPPLVLLHGAQVSSPVWYANVAQLSQHFRLYAPDVVDQMGRSVPTRKLLKRDDYANWLAEVLDALHLERVPIVGHSQGGWQALNMALLHPQRVERLLLLSPGAAFAPLRWQLIFRLLPTFIVPTRRVFYWSFQAMTTLPLDTEKPNPIIEQIMIGSLSFKPQELSLGPSSVFSDEELRGVNIPTLLLIGDKEVIYEPNMVLERARRLMPHIEAELIAGGGHLFPIDQANATNARMLEFLKDSC